MKPESMSQKALVEFCQTGSYFNVPFLGKSYKITYPSGEILCLDEQIDVQLPFKIVLLHYLTHCSSRVVEGCKIAFRELPNGSIYVTPFTNRSIKPLIAIFGANQNKLIQAAQLLGGWREDIGDVAVTIPVLPKIPITFVLWEGDDEFPPTGNVLFDASASSHLHTEDYALLPGLTIWEMKKIVET